MNEQIIYMSIRVNDIMEISSEKPAVIMAFKKKISLYY